MSSRSGSGSFCPDIAAIIHVCFAAKGKLNRLFIFTIYRIDIKLEKCLRQKPKLWPFVYNGFFFRVPENHNFLLFSFYITSKNTGVVKSIRMTHSATFIGLYVINDIVRYNVCIYRYNKKIRVINVRLVYEIDFHVKQKKWIYIKDVFYPWIFPTSIWQDDSTGKLHERLQSSQIITEKILNEMFKWKYQTQISFM